MVINPIKFDGSNKKPGEWLLDFDHAIEQNGWSDDQVVKYFSAFLENAALDWYRTNALKKINPGTTWLQLRKLFESYFMADVNQISLLQQLEECRQGNESISVFMPKIVKIMNLINKNVTEEEIIWRIKTKLKPSLQKMLATSQITTIDELNRLGKSCELTLENLNTTVNRQSNKNVTNYRKNDSTSNSGKYAKTQMDNKSSYKKNDIKIKEQTKNNYSKDDKCNICDRGGHLAKGCVAKFKQDGTPIIRKNVQANIELEECDIDVVTTITTATIDIDSIDNMENTPLPNHIFTKLLVNGSPIKAMVDTGARLSVVSLKIAKQFNWPIFGTPPKLVTADNKPMKSYGFISAKITMTIGKVKKFVQHRVAVIENLNFDFILGLQLLRLFNLIIECGHNNLSFHKNNNTKGVVVNNTQLLKPRTITDVEATASVVGTILFRPMGDYNENLMVANSVNVVENKPFLIKAINFGNKDIILNNNFKIGYFELIDDNNIESINAIIQITENCEDFVTVGDQLSLNQLNDLKWLFKRYLNIFSINGELGTTNLIQHNIQLIDNSKPYVEPFRRHPETHKLEAAKQVRSMLNQNIIEPSKSSWANEYVMVKKKNGEFRMCIDYRKLNNLTIKEAYPLPNIDECLDNLAGKKYFSQLDFRSGYWQIPIADKSKELTAFRTDEGLFQFVKMPFGLCNAPAFFQKLINALLVGLKGQAVQCFIDDICIASNNWNEHLTMLERIFKLIATAGLKLNGSKCNFGPKSTIFLGHLISNEGIMQDPNKLKAISCLPSPKDGKSLQRALGLLNSYRKFVPNYATLAVPLTRLTRKGVIFRWTSNEETVFRKLIEEFTKNMSLAHFKQNAETILKTDASKEGIGAILLQLHDNDWKIIHCISRQTNKSETNYGITELEALAVIYAVKKLRHYLLGRKFKIIVDHCPLCSLNLKDPASARL